MDTALAIFAYRRADKLAALREAVAGWQGPIRIYCDGARGGDDAGDVAAVRAEARNFVGAVVVERPENYGLSRNLRGGIGETLSTHEAVIVLEDDVQPRTGCLDFFTWGLEQAKAREDIFSVSAYHPLGGEGGLPELFLSQRFLCWGWATWADRWREIAPDLNAGQPPWRHYWEVPTSGGDDLRWALRSHRMGHKPATWAHLTSMLCLARGWKHLCPRPILIENTGFDGSGEHCGPGDIAGPGSVATPRFDAGDIPEKWVWPEGLALDTAIGERIAEKFALPPEPPIKRLRRYLSYRIRARS